MTKNLSDALRDLLKTNTLIQEVFDWEDRKFKGDPHVQVFAITPPSASYATTAENHRIYSFMVRCYVARGTTYRTDQESERVMRELVDSIVDDLDKNYYGQNLGIAYKTGYAMHHLEAATPAWGYADLGESYRVAEIPVHIHLEVNVTLIS